MIVPSLRRERNLWNSGIDRIAGVDEVGVAPTSGPVVAAAVIMKAGCKRIPGVRDSKTLSEAQREKLYPVIRRRAVAVGVGAASVARDRSPEHLPRHAPGDASRDPPARRSRARARRWQPHRRVRAACRAVHRHRRWRRHLLHDRVRVGRGEGRSRSPHDTPCRAVSRVRLGPESRLRVARAPRGDARLRA